MTKRVPVQTPLAIDQIESARVNAETVRLKLAGRWLDPAGAAEEELLVVQVQGRRHRFPASRDPASDDPERWSASFTLPVWAEPRHTGQAALWLGSAVIPVAPPRGAGAAPAGPPPVAPEPPAAVVPPPVAARGPPAAVAPPVASEPPAAVAPPVAAPGPLISPGADTPRSGPLADLLLRETVSALHAELSERTADAARMRGALADAQSELEARSATQASLEAAHGQLRAELERLTGAVERQRKLDQQLAEAEQERDEMRHRLAELTAARDQRADEVAELRQHIATLQATAQHGAAEAARLREDLAAANVASDAAVSEVTGLRNELQRLGGELAATRERVGAESGELGEAERLLAEARALAEQLRGEG